MVRRGFTLPELVVTLLLVAILAFVAIPQLFHRAEYEARSLRDELAAALRFAQKAAIAQRRSVCGQITSGAGGSVALRVDTDENASTGTAGCEADQSGPTGKSPHQVLMPPEVTLSVSPAVTTLVFDRNGVPNTNVNIVFTLTGGGASYSVTVERGTGYVH